jgi:hypothetical protein
MCFKIGITKNFELITMTDYGIGQQQKILPYQNISVVQDTSHPNQLLMIHDR